MKQYLEKLKERHRELNRKIDNRKAIGSQHDMPRLKRMRLHLKDQISALKRQIQPGSTIS